MFREMRRKNQLLPPAMTEEILRRGSHGTLAVLGDGGYPYVVPLSYVYHGGKLYFHCAKSGHKLDALRACDKACFTVIDEPQQEAGDWWYHVRSVICFGRAHVIEDEQEKDRRLRQLGQKYFPDGYNMESDLQRNAGHALVLAFRIEHCSGKRVREK